MMSSGLSPFNSPSVKQLIDDMRRVSDFHAHIVERNNLLRQANVTYRSLNVVEDTASGKLADGNRVLMPEADESYVARVCDFRSFKLPIFGSNSAGKSTFLNTLLGMDVLPTGEGTTTARVCVVSYAPMDQACIKYWTLSALKRGNEGEVHVERLTDEEKTKSGLTRKMSTLLSRQYAPKGEEPFASWVRTIVEVCYPFPILAGGLSLVDLPGVASVDARAVQEVISEYFRHDPPIAMLLIYDNATFADSETSALEVFVESVKDCKDVNLFLVNSKVDNGKIKEVYDNKGLELPTGKDSAEQMCKMVANFHYEILRADRPRLGPFQLADTADKFGAFCTVSSSAYNKAMSRLKGKIVQVWQEANGESERDLATILEKLTPAQLELALARLTPLERATKHMFEVECLEKILKWSVLRQTMRYVDALDKMRSGIHIFFGNLMAAHETHIETLMKQQEDAAERLAAFEANLQSSLEKYMHPDRIKEEVKAHAQMKPIVESIKRKAAQIRLDQRFEGKGPDGDLLYYEAATKDFDEKFLPILRQFVNDEVIQVAVNRVHEEADSVAERFSKDASEANDLLATVLDGFHLAPDQFTSAIQLEISKVKSTISSLIRLQWQYRDSITSFFWQTTQNVMSEVRQRVTGNAGNIDSRWKIQYAALLLERVHEIFSNEAVRAAMNESIKSRVADLRKRVEHSVTQINNLRDAAERAPKAFQKLRSEAHELLAYCLADRSFLLSVPLPNFDRNSALSSGDKSDNCRIYSVKNERIKVFVQDRKSDCTQALQHFFDEVRFNIAIKTKRFTETKLCATRLLCVFFDSLSSTYKLTSPTDPANMNRNLEWHLVSPLAKTNLDQLLRIEKVYWTDKQCVDLGITLASYAYALLESGLTSTLQPVDILASLYRNAGSTSDYSIDIFPGNIQSMEQPSHPTSSSSRLMRTSTTDLRIRIMKPLGEILRAISPGQPYPSPEQPDLTSLPSQWRDILEKCNSRSGSPLEILRMLKQLKFGLGRPESLIPPYRVYHPPPRDAVSQIRLQDELQHSSTEPDIVLHRQYPTSTSPVPPSPANSTTSISQSNITKETESTQPALLPRKSSEPPPRPSAPAPSTSQFHLSPHSSASNQQLKAPYTPPTLRLGSYGAHSPVVVTLRQALDELTRHPWNSPSFAKLSTSSGMTTPSAPIQATHTNPPLQAANTGQLPFSPTQTPQQSQPHQKPRIPLSLMGPIKFTLENLPLFTQRACRVEMCRWDRGGDQGDDEYTFGVLATPDQGGKTERYMATIFYDFTPSGVDECRQDFEAYVSEFPGSKLIVLYETLEPQDLLSRVPSDWIRTQFQILE